MTGMDIEQCSAMKGEAVKLMAKCQVAVHAQPGIVTVVHRGMIVNDIEGKEVGKVAAVAVGSCSQQALCLILGYLPEKELYQSLPVIWIDRVDGEAVYLNVNSEEVQALPEWHPG